jgi:transposase-like protein
MAKLSRILAQEAVNAVNENGGNRAAAARSLEISRGMMYSRLQEAKRLYDLEPNGANANANVDSAGPKVGFEDNGDTMTVWQASDVVCTEEEALEKAGIYLAG